MKKIIIIVAFAVVTVATQAQISIVSVPAPTAFEVKICQKDSDLYINLAGSEEGVSYQLYKKRDEFGKYMPIGDQIKGTGKQLTFPLPADRTNITCMVKASNACGEFEMKNTITSDDMKKVMESHRECCTNVNGILTVNKKTFDPGILSKGNLYNISIDLERLMCGMTVVNQNDVIVDTSDDSILTTSDWIAIVVFAGIFLLVGYGIWNRRRLVLNSNMKMEPLCTGTVNSSKHYKK